MKILICLLLPLSSFCQFHVAVEANPANEGETNVAWKNNYVVTVTNDNWKTKQIIEGRATYEGYDDNGITFYTCYYQPCVFQEKQEAISFAKQFNNFKSFRLYEQKQYKDYTALKAKFERDNKRLCFRCKEKKNEKPKPVVVY